MCAHGVGQGTPAADAGRQALGIIGQTVQSQATILSYIDVFWVGALFAAVMIAFALLLRPVELGGAAHAAH